MRHGTIYYQQCCLWWAKANEKWGGQKPEGGDSLHLFSIYEEGGVVMSVLPEVHDEFFCLLDIQGQVVVWAP